MVAYAAVEAWEGRSAQMAARMGSPGLHQHLGLQPQPATPLPDGRLALSWRSPWTLLRHRRLGSTAVQKTSPLAKQP